MVKTFNLEHKIILITGGYGFLGKAVAESLLHHGAKIYVLGRSKERFDEAFGSVQSSAHCLFFTACDVSSSESIIEAYKEIYNSNGRIDVLINNAFYIQGQSPKAMSDEEWDVGIDGTLSSTFRCIREIIPYFENQKSGNIINVSSMYGIVAPDFKVYEEFPAFLNPPHYGAAKAAIIQLTRYYASFLGHLGVNVNVITPGPFPSLLVQQSEGFVQQLEHRTLLNRIGKPEDLAGAFVFLSSDAANFITGQNIIIDGGWTIR